MSATPTVDPDLLECDDCHAPAGEPHHYACIYLLDLGLGDDDHEVCPPEIHVLLPVEANRFGEPYDRAVADLLSPLFDSGVVTAWRLAFPPGDARHGAGPTVPAERPTLPAGRRWFTVALTLPLAAPQVRAEDTAVWAPVAAVALAGEPVVVHGRQQAAPGRYAVAGDFPYQPASCRDDSGQGRWLAGGRLLICMGCGTDCT
ncbi:hypothetical protein GCM10010123_01990 [Pilimelia anulata]|uniref:Uncharacterized protein n=1 Tax=Pilimelia anulata TaxID=53371 RepID=A0A8J3B673_9ACTN|nr:hypothetical protein [Pilimelia anulata]GGJ75605.1 hypothetical protein GCM10010123_01990 [Pilimelia anulata]